MSIPNASRPGLRQYDAVRTRKYHDQQAQYFTICQLGSHPDPVHCSFVDRDGIQGAIYCEENSGVTIQYSIKIDLSAIIFEIVGRLDETNCFITPDGDKGHPCGLEEDANDPFASFWFKAPSNAHGDIIAWERGLKQLERLAQSAAGAGVAMGELLALDYNRGPRSPLALLQLGWRAPHPYTLEYLPVFTANYVHHPIPSLASAPFGKHICMRFTLQQAHATATVPAIAGARLLSMRILD